jgi:LmbE family N-acetylglucosaminyl deacetylase
MEQLPEEWQRAAAIVAHPDDLEYGVASAIARLTGQGKEVAYVLATSGEAGIDGVLPDVAGPLRQEEERRGAALVGVRQVEFLGHVDGAVEYGLALRRDLCGALRRLRPDVVITLHFDLTWGEGGAVNHADHRHVGLAVLDACRDAGNRWMFPDIGQPWSGVHDVYVAATATPTHYVDVTATLDLGISSLREHRAYLDGLGTDFDPDSFLRRSAVAAGEEVGCPLAVLFRHFAV